MKTTLIFFFVATLSCSAQFRIVQGRIYSLTDEGAGWTVFREPKRVIGFVQPNGIEVQCFHYETSAAGMDHLDGGIYRQLTDTHCVNDGTVVLVNYPFMNRYNRGDVIMDVIYAMRVQNLRTTESGPSYQTAARGDFNEDISSHTEYNTDDQVFDCGTPWNPPPPVMTPAAKLALEVKTFHWLQLQATNGSVSAQCSLGKHYMDGVGTETNSANGIYWLQKAADAGDTESSNALAQIAAGNSPTNLVAQ